MFPGVCMRRDRQTEREKDRERQRGREIEREKEIKTKFGKLLEMRAYQVFIVLYLQIL
jgi:hypothetical protein